MPVLAHDRTQLPIHVDTMETGSPTTHRPFGLTLSRPSVPSGDVLDLTDTHLDPVTQTIVGADGVTLASKPQTTQKVTTNEKTVHDHQSWNDSKTDTYQD
ncbi:putative ATP-grasp-modified RiPP [Micromonospora sp. NPDC050695]|uniref:putative ATP-grasp-modified RiPP n=1 Tax=Micromonospora sp. NPDC050695 TaxID=3154938 RepID=UPI0033F2609C